MIRRIAVVCVLVLAVSFTGAAVAKKKKKRPQVPVGPYVGMTSDGIPLTVTLDPGRATGSISYCALTATFTVSGGVSSKSFAVSYVDPVSQDTINATGFFSAKQRSVTGTVAPNGCDSTQQSFSAQHG